jgi:transposase
MQCIGFDVHKQSFFAAILDTETGQTSHHQGPVTPEALRTCLSGPEPKRAVFEAGRTWSLFYDMIQDLVDDVVMAHPLKVRAIAEAKVKTDKVDATTLAQLLAADLIPSSHLRDRENREAQQILRQRLFFVRLRTRLKNRIHVLIDRQWPEIRGCLAGLSDIFGKTGLKLLRTLPLSARDRQLLDEMLALYDHLTDRIQGSNEQVKTHFETDRDAQRLATIPGLGVFLATLVRVEIDRIDRFKSAGHLCSYAGLVPSVHQSGQKRWTGRINKQGNRWLRWALIEAVSPAVTNDVELRVYRQRIKRRKGTMAARMATARRLLTICYHVLKEQRDFISRERKDRVAFARP